MKILIGIPTSVQKNYCFPEFFENVSRMEHDYIICDNSKGSNPLLKGTNHIYAKHDKNIRQSIVNSQNAIREQFLKGDYTHLAFLESDLIPDIHVFEALARHDKDVVGHGYFVNKHSMREYMIHDSLFIEELNTISPVPTSIEMGYYMCDGKVHRVHSVGFGCVLIKRYVIEKIKFHVNTSDEIIDSGTPSSSDSFFAADCALNGINVFVDTSKTIMHYNQDWN